MDSLNSARREVALAESRAPADDVSVPVTFSGCAGAYHAASGPVGVLLCAPWGFEDFRCRKMWRLLAERIAAAGFPCLRFDYPGTGNSLGEQETADLARWEQSVADAAAVLSERSGATRFVLVGQRLGALIAYRAARAIDGVEGLVLMAPVVAGRVYGRELAAWAQLMAGSVGYALDPAPDGGVALAGFRLPGSVLAALRPVNLLADTAAPSNDILVVQRPDQPLEAEFADRLRTLGATVDVVPYQGYDALVSDPIAPATPWETLDGVLGWLAARYPSAPDVAAPAAAAATPPALLAGDGFEERLVRFGPAGRLAGVLCRPLAARRGPTAILMNTGSDHHTGWGRLGVEHARALARQGIASLRFDTADIGDSPAWPDGPDQVVYSAEQTDDATSAIDFVEDEGLLPVALIGRCSGAFLAFNAAHEDERVASLVLVNQARFIWDPAVPVEEALRFVPRSLDDYRARLVNPQTLRRMLRGEVDVWNGGSNLIRQLSKALGNRFAPHLVRGTAWNERYREAHRRFAHFRERGVPIALVYSAGDIALEEFAAYLGDQGERLSEYPNMSFTLVPDADHNFTPAAASEALLRHIVVALSAVSAPGGSQP